MKRIVLIGDSIRMGYQGQVAARLSDLAEVWGPEENCAHSDRTREHLSQWVIDRKPDLVHYNNGLHDLARDPLEDGRMGVPRVPANRYIENLRHNLQAIREAGIEVIFALTTPVNEKAHHERKGFDRLESDVENYNRIAAALMGEMGVPVNDLYQLVMEAGRDRLLLPDGVHFTEEGYQVLGDAVAGVIRDRLVVSAV